MFQEPTCNLSMLLSIIKKKKSQYILLIISRLKKWNTETERGLVRIIEKMSFIIIFKLIENINVTIHTKSKLNYKNTEKQLLIWKKWIKNSLEKKFKMIKQAGMNKFYKQYKTTRHTHRGTKCNEEFCQKAPQVVSRSAIALP